MNASHPHINQAVILAGGLGTRLRPLTDQIPKPMIPFHGRPFAAFLLEKLKEQGIQEVVFLLGYLSHVVEEFFGDGKRFGISIRYSVQPIEAETGSRLRAALPLLDDAFLLMYCDNYWPLSLRRMETFWHMTSCEAMLTIYSNSDHFTRDNVQVSPEGKILVYDKSRSAPGLAGVDIGFGFFRRRHVECLPEGNVSFEKSLYPLLVERGQLAGYVSDHRYYSVGSIDRLDTTARFLKFEPAILLDRDGVLNVKAPRGEYVCTPEEFQWLPGAREALARITAAQFRIFIVSNQAGIARGALTQADLEAIHEKMLREAAAAGARIDGVYVCPHGWDENCACRKPKPGLLFQAQKEHSLDLSRTWFLGDDERDLTAGHAAGCPCGLVTAEVPLHTWLDRILPPDLQQANHGSEHSTQTPNPI